MELWREGRGRRGDTLNAVLFWVHTRTHTHNQHKTHVFQPARTSAAAAAAGAAAAGRQRPLQRNASASVGPLSCWCAFETRRVRQQATQAQTRVRGCRAPHRGRKREREGIGGLCAADDRHSSHSSRKGGECHPPPRTPVPQMRSVTLTPPFCLAASLAARPLPPRPPPQARGMRRTPRHTQRVAAGQDADTLSPGEYRVELVLEERELWDGERGTDVGPPAAPPTAVEFDGANCCQPDRAPTRPANCSSSTPCSRHPTHPHFPQKTTPTPWSPPRPPPTKPNPRASPSTAHWPLPRRRGTGRQQMPSCTT